MRIDNHYKSNNLLTVLALFICIFNPLSDFGISNIFGWVFLVGVWLLNTLKHHGRLYLTKSRLGYCLVVLVVFIFFCMPNARNDNKSTQALIINIFFCGLYLLSADVSKREIHSIMKIFATSSVIFSVYIIFCRIFPEIYLNVIVPRLRGVDAIAATLSIRRGYGAHIANSITFGPYVITMGMFCCLPDILFGGELFGKKTAVFYEILFLAAILCEGRRSELIAVILALLVIYIISTSKRASEILKRVGALFIIGIVGVVLVVFLLRQGFLARYVTTIDLLQGGLTIDMLNRLTSSRYRLWMFAWEFFKSSPLIGIGWSSFSLYVETAVNNVHNCYLQFLCETGIVGFALILMPFLFLLVKSTRQMKIIVREREISRSSVGSTILISVGMQVYFLLLYAMDPVFYKGYYHMMHIMLIIFYEYATKIFNQEMKEEQHYANLGEYEGRNTL